MVYTKTSVYIRIFEVMGEILDSHLKAYQGDNIYDFDNEIILNWYPKRIVHHADVSSSILELGLGHGFSTKIFAKYFQKHLVLEGSAAVIKNFKSKNHDLNIEIKETYFEKFSTEEKFDVIIMGFILEHVDDPFDILKQYLQFLAPGGSIFVAVPNAEVMNRRLGQLAGLLDDISELSQNDYLLGHKRYYTVSSLTKVIKEAGYNIKNIEGIYLKPFTTSQIINLDLDQKIIDALCKLGLAYPELSCGILAEITAG